jgi:uncharacterized protein DUF3417
MEDELWEPLDSELWEVTHNSWLVLLTASLSKLRSPMANPNHRRKVEKAARIEQDYLNAPTWFQQRHQQSPLSCVAYFSMAIHAQRSAADLPSFADASSTRDRAVRQEEWLD